MPIRILLSWCRFRSGSGSTSYRMFYTCWKIRSFFNFIHSSDSLHFVFLVRVTVVIIINILDSILKFPERMVYLVKMDSDPDPDLPKWYRSFRIRIHNTGLYRFPCDIVGKFAVLHFLCRAVHSVAPSSELSLVRWSDISPASARSLEPSM